jgi:hypothetical protein
MDYRKLIRHIASGGLFVNVYDVSSNYGGPEEGGWYYDAGELLESLPAANEQEAQDIHKKLEAKYAIQNAERQPPGTTMLNDPQAEIPEDWEPESQADDESYVHSEGEIRVFIEEHPGRNFPTERPYYS